MDLIDDLKSIHELVDFYADIIYYYAAAITTKEIIIAR